MSLRLHLAAGIGFCTPTPGGRRHPRYPAHLTPLKILPTLLAAAALLPVATVQAQTCLDNVFPLTLVDALGQPLPTLVEGQLTYGVSPDSEVYVALPANMPSGSYFVQVIDSAISTVLADSLQFERVFEVQNVGGVISITRLASNPNLPAPGLGLFGVGQSIPLFPLVAPPAGSAPCRFKVFIGECYLSSWNPNTAPYGLPFGIRPNDGSGNCCTRSFAQFIVGDGSGAASVSGTVFEDLDQDGVRDPGEPGLAGLTVCLTLEDEVLCVVTAANGSYVFPGVSGGAYELTLQALPDGSFIASTPLSRSIEASGCELLEGVDFGGYRLNLTCQGRTRGFWQNCNGKKLIAKKNLLNRLPALKLRTKQGALFTTTNYNTFRSWLKAASATNMAYMLSAQLVAMDFNRAVGFVDGNCRIQDPHLGLITIDQLIELAKSSLQAHGYTPSGHPARAMQERIKNALDRANNNVNWL